MIQLQYEPSGSVSRAIFSDLQPPTTASQFTIALTSSFEGEYSEINVDVTSNKSNAYNGGWVLFDVSNNDVPIKSGHYTANIYEGITIQGETWANATEIWGQATDTWANYIQGGVQATWAQATQTWGETEVNWISYILPSVLGRLITTERVFVSGSDFDTIDTYENQELAYYNVYNG